MMPSACKVPVSKYNSSDVVQDRCNKIIRWQELARNVRPSRCHVDPHTKMMICKRENTCQGGHNMAHDFTSVTKTLTYNCRAKCKGPLLLDCCETCLKAQGSAEQWGLDSIQCEGCDNSEMEEEAQKADCVLQDGKFHCHNKPAACEAGEPSETRNEVHYRCNIYPCSNCKAPHLKAKCCAECLKMMCTNSSSLQDRMACEGCDNPESSQSWWSSLNVR